MIINNVFEQLPVEVHLEGGLQLREDGRHLEGGAHLMLLYTILAFLLATEENRFTLPIREDFVNT